MADDWDDDEAPGFKYETIRQRARRLELQAWHLRQIVPTSPPRA